MSRDLIADLGSAGQDNLIAGPKFPIQFKGVTLAPGQGILPRGTVLGIITAGGQAAAVDSSSADGSEKPDCVLAEDIDTGSGNPVAAVAYSAGYFIRGALIFGGTDTWETHERELRTLNIHLSASIDSEGAVH